MTIFRKSKLYEVSIVTIPANDNAVILRSAKLNTDSGAAKQRIEKMEETLKREHEKLEELKLGALTVSVRIADLERFKLFEAEFIKYRDYFEKKQPANKAATSVLKKFFEKADEKQPDDEVKAWGRMSELIDQRATEEKTEEEPAAEAVTEPITAPASEAPAQRSIPLSVLKAAPQAFPEQALRAVEKHLRSGGPAKDIPKVLDLVGNSFLKSLTQLARHSDIKQTMKYTHIGMGDRAKALANLPFQE
jgi:hypothetical protein